MIEILRPGDGRRLDDLRELGVAEVDVWSSAIPELRTLDKLEHVDPDAERVESFDLDDPSEVDARTRYIYFPWRSTLVRMPDEHVYYRLKTARNRHLLTSREQEQWSRARIGVAGLSIGSSVLTACSLTGARHFHIADPDELAPTNLNRLPNSVCDIGRGKLELAHRRILESDPYSTIAEFPNGYAPADADAFLGLDGEPLTVVVEEIDDVALKIDLRRRARAARIPVVSATDMGDNVVLDIERFDLDADYPIFHGRGEHFTAGDAEDPRQKLRMAATIVGDTLTPRMAYSAGQLGRSIASWPQLGSTATMAGAVVAVATRNIVCGRPVASGRFVVDVEGLLLGSAAREAQGWNEFGAEEIAGLVSALTGG
ncbi:ThiF family adenylyltransferase [Gordonia sp. CPCC 205515]|uniref:ThiF family adenylyltransferase n=1 Tax=Gordonia sp. CPCC 205515 TaxID=3140791 RepID=UPI003AF394F5